MNPKALIAHDNSQMMNLYFLCFIRPMCSMYGIFAYIQVIFGVNVNTVSNPVWALCRHIILLEIQISWWPGLSIHSREYNPSFSFFWTCLILAHQHAKMTRSLSCPLRILCYPLSFRQERVHMSEMQVKRWNSTTNCPTWTMVKALFLGSCRIMSGFGPWIHGVGSDPPQLWTGGISSGFFTQRATHVYIYVYIYI